MIAMMNALTYSGMFGHASTSECKFASSDEQAGQLVSLLCSARAAQRDWQLTQVQVKPKVASNSARAFRSSFFTPAIAGETC